MNKWSNDLLLDLLKKAPSHPSFFFANDGIILPHIATKPTLPLQKTIETLRLKILSAHLNGETIIIECESPLTAERLAEKGYKIYPVKQLLSQIDTTNQRQLLRAYHWLNWNHQSQYCGQCGTPLQNQFSTTEKKCVTCHLSFFPRFSPAVMVLIQKEDQLLLARSPHFQPGMYSAIAGFIDIGESAEHAAHREVEEEIGLKIKDLDYFSSQTWPFPDSFMIAFKAKYLSGKLKRDPNEIEDARWFPLHDLPQLPSHSSIARKLIDSVILDQKTK